MEIVIGKAKSSSGWRVTLVVALLGTGPWGHWQLGEVIGRCQLVHVRVTVSSGMTSLEMEGVGINTLRMAVVLPWNMGY